MPDPTGLDDVTCCTSQRVAIRCSGFVQLKPLFSQPTDAEYRRFKHRLHVLPNRVEPCLELTSPMPPDILAIMSQRVLTASVGPQTATINYLLYSLIFRAENPAFITAEEDRPDGCTVHMDLHGDGDAAPVIISATSGVDEKTVQVMHWGLIPSFVPDAVKQASKPSQFSTANARADTLFERPAYRESLRRGWRCVVIAQGFYEWKTSAGRKQPYFISVDVITTDAVNEVASIHNRMPVKFGYTSIYLPLKVIFANFDDAMRWVQGGLVSAGEVRSFLTEMIAKLPHMNLLVYPVTPMVNSSAFDDPACIKPQGLLPSVTMKSKTTPSKTLDAFMIISPQVGAVGKKEGSYKRSPPQLFGELFHVRKRSFSDGDSNIPPKYIKPDRE
ncbi:unnamed protein product [Schistocephalus solidus]|uniref:Abasic site processing protein HMCES n=1 Tax=Schistocephalus solidus TaxID=70667 RepID=A0A183SQV9_SCHSO|nr:unnamed protein product [Schistocephalus solidus]